MVHQDSFDHFAIRRTKEEFGCLLVLKDFFAGEWYDVESVGKKFSIIFGECGYFVDILDSLVKNSCLYLTDAVWLSLVFGAKCFESFVVKKAIHISVKW
ncbi:MAG: hypothetical protein H6766_04640 [Candidatus Peribacteria bacterium]|nr:MAG: hypothetical protein H6766_04640 [Candidatus Peribacteria bacterium]